MALEYTTGKETEEVRNFAKVIDSSNAGPSAGRIG
jgi:hypothetical protein